MAVGTLQNRLTNVAPFEDDFNDGNYTGWVASTSAWSAAGNTMASVTPATAFWRYFYKGSAEPDSEIQFSYCNRDTSGGNNRCEVFVRREYGTNDLVRVIFYPGSAIIQQLVGAAYTTLDTDTSADSIEDVWYDVRVVSDGANVEVWWGERGEQMTKILETASTTVAVTNQYRFEIAPNATVEFDNIRIIADGLTATTTYAYNSDNQLTSQSDVNGTTTCTYDDWGRMLSKARGGHSADYEYRQLGRLRTITTDFPDEAYTIYVTGADGNRRTTGDGTNFVHYKYGSNYDMLSAETSGTWAVQRTWVHDPGKGIGAALAEIEGSNPSTGTYEYLWTDQVGSTRHVLDGSKAVTASFAYSPYGESLLSSGGNVTALQFSGKMWDGGTGLYFFPFRYYSPDMGRWISRDPLGLVDGPNVYAYVTGNPVNNVYPLGLSVKWPCNTLAGYLLCLIAPPICCPRKIPTPPPGRPTKYEQCFRDCLFRGGSKQECELLCSTHPYVPAPGEPVPC